MNCFQFFPGEKNGQKSDLGKCLKRVIIKEKGTFVNQHGFNKTQLSFPEGGIFTFCFPGLEIKYGALGILGKSLPLNPSPAYVQLTLRNTD